MFIILDFTKKKLVAVFNLKIIFACATWQLRFFLQS